MRYSYWCWKRILFTKTEDRAKLPAWIEVDETWEKRLRAVVLGPKGERLGLHLSGPGFN